MTDPCACSEVCPHGQTCLAGHANYPDNHWYRCDRCTQVRTLTFEQLLAEARARLVDP